MTDADFCYRYRETGGVWKTVPHVFRQQSELYDACVWCGKPQRRAVIVADAPECCTRQATYARPTITERHAGEPVLRAVHTGTVSDIEERFTAMARAYAAQSNELQQWIKQGNKLPRCYT